MRLINLIPLQEIDFASQKGFDAYSKQHKLRPDTKVKIAGKTTTAGQASKVKGTVWQDFLTRIFFCNQHPAKDKVTFSRLEQKIGPLTRRQFFFRIF